MADQGSKASVKLDYIGATALNHALLLKRGAAANAQRIDQELEELSKQTDAKLEERKRLVELGESESARVVKSLGIVVDGEPLGLDEISVDQAEDGGVVVSWSAPNSAESKVEPKPPAKSRRARKAKSKEPAAAGKA